MTLTRLTVHPQSLLVAHELQILSGLHTLKVKFFKGKRVDPLDITSLLSVVHLTSKMALTESQFSTSNVTKLVKKGSNRSRTSSITGSSSSTRSFGVVQAENHDEITSIETLQLDLSTIMTATNDFSDANRLGEGGFRHMKLGGHNWIGKSDTKS
ncbi:hypothetical protein VIGAN_07071500 [Vigna angularis var. angularis]|uniref:Uncharacterized protein n=1 Tax=Vigna angularis var. angularis TaxID=157739 RepID=A0A0S3SGX4_PHAAN|nr:hypothetical protein VIGAN_07071500 [Vigna angularis var. angularis]